MDTYKFDGSGLLVITGTVTTGGTPVAVATPTGKTFIAVAIIAAKATWQTASADGSCTFDSSTNGTTFTAYCKEVA